jgi:hypothetical protein
MSRLVILFPCRYDLIRKLHGLPELPVDFSETHTICGIGAAPQELLSKKQRAL